MSVFDLVNYGFKTLQVHSPLLGRLWMLLMLALRMALLSSVAGDMFQDEQVEFTCNTLQPGCKQVCFSKVFPVSLYRFWVFHIVVVATPSLLYLIFAMHHKPEPQEGGPARQGCLREAGVMKKLRRYYFINVLLRLAAEVGFLIGQWKLYGFQVSPQFPCTEPPCPYTVDCFTSRPMEKTVFMWFYFVMAILSALMSVAEAVWTSMKLLEKPKPQSQHRGPRPGSTGPERQQLSAASPPPLKTCR
ncbi:gap junction delta-3 protein-like [Denticeps clupeoides]|uniref:gap junction delta-3 protein-like n=1 Tax=Denticeps clupeoides TaxID=299321 RepID=UPI0010A4EE81|nr:gap junction delta-3 protein [Denticeps clupeoides]